ncbi:dTDP-4-dehydrorhamnose 3,5-epimerase [Paenibacillus oryzae]|uniref:dTDP-4-dehydrorhamnose 3,5-epimerase n=1 Tax=Paenibacillus oryzae TaxID=1844972 RepID=A0A1A5YS20_9BACL|nr:dTDP-4-dehydrorhamnose 3,5-epimerase [Paenibacillus oryzae]OBR68417.1 dTDP-4-dehydrorhamnose 3,5-epimerase [Paenibacillus oryzae]
MKLTTTQLDGVIIIEPTVHGDHRGWFMETYSESRLESEGVDITFVQDNHSFSAAKGTLRGLHYQINPKAQTKMVRCTRGAIYDVAVDIRKGSPTFGQWVGVELSEENKKQLLVPKGFAHGFMTLMENTEVQYKVDEVYSKEHDRGIRWNDSEIGIQWPLGTEPILSEKDEIAPLLGNAEYNFIYGE